MKIAYCTKDCTDLPDTIETAGPDQSYPWMKPGIVYNFDGTSGEYGPTEYTPAQARELSAALLQAADDAEGGDYPTVTAAELRTGDVLNADARIVVVKVHRVGDVVNVRWESAGYRWMDTYSAADRIRLVRRGPEESK